ncbi:MAG TPA: hypothetical protein VJT67_02195, partial [Longimicrobiaceae bacterium]|nr:hypothetical protein [Longimicrobiaceae bacterium]
MKTSFRTSIPVDAARTLARRPIGKLFITLAHKRSGHHAVIDWVLSQHDGLRVHHNFANRRAGADLLEPCESHWTSSSGGIPVGEVSAASVNFENSRLAAEDELWAIVQRCTQAFPGAGRICVLIVVRDSYNTYASCLQRYLTQAKKASAWNADSWRGHAQLFLQADRLRRANVDVFGISFNRWVSDLNFRRALAESLAVPRFLPVPGRVSPFGA